MKKALNVFAMAFTVVVTLSLVISVVLNVLMYKGSLSASERVSELEDKNARLADEIAVLEKDPSAGKSSEALRRSVEQLNDKIAYLQDENEYMTYEMELMQEEMDYLYDLAFILDEYVVFVENDGTNLYHSYECTLFEGYDYMLYDIDYVEELGYSPCKGCCLIIDYEHYSVGLRYIILEDLETAEYICDVWESGGALEEDLIALMQEYGADQGGGEIRYYEPGELCEEIESWCFRRDRCTGDAALIYTPMGYAVCYFCEAVEITE